MSNIDVSSYRPWHSSLVSTLSGATKNNTLHHAMLLQGPPGMGKRVFAKLFADYLLCLESDKGSGLLACGSCAACALTKAGTHPDFHRLEPKEANRQISVDRVREVQEPLLKTAQLGGSKVCLVEPADLLNESSASALLKLLEEPPQNTFFLLVADRAQYILPTIRSRCILLAFLMPDASALKDALLAISPDGEKVGEALANSRGFPEFALELVQGCGSERPGLQNNDLLDSVLSDWASGRTLDDKKLNDLLNFPLEGVLDNLMYRLLELDKQLQSQQREQSQTNTDLSTADVYAVSDVLLHAKRLLPRNPNARLLLKSLGLQVQPNVRNLTGIY